MAVVYPFNITEKKKDFSYSHDIQEVWMMQLPVEHVQLITVWEMTVGYGMDFTLSQNTIKGQHWFKGSKDIDTLSKKKNSMLSE